MHDWNWDNGKFRYYTRVAEDRADVVIIFSMSERDLTDDQLDVLYPNRKKIDEDQPGLR